LQALHPSGDCVDFLGLGKLDLSDDGTLPADSFGLEVLFSSYLELILGLLYLFLVNDLVFKVARHIQQFLCVILRNNRGSSKKPLKVVSRQKVTGKAVKRRRKSRKSTKNAVSGEKRACSFADVYGECILQESKAENQDS
jgi:hypothetical protein